MNPHGLRFPSRRELTGGLPLLGKHFQKGSVVTGTPLRTAACQASLPSPQKGKFQGAHPGTRPHTGLQPREGNAP